MAGTVTFFLNHSKAENATPIYLAYLYGEDRILISTGEKILPGNWNQKKHKARESQRFTDGKNLNIRLKNHKENVLDAVGKHLNTNKTVLLDKLRVELIEVIRPKPQKEPEKITFFGKIEEYISNTNKSIRTKLSYGTTLNILKKYDNTLKHKLTFESIDMDFYENFVKYLTDFQRTLKKKTIKGYSKNTIGDHIKKVKVFMNYANDKGYTTNKGHLHRKFQTVEETPETIYLTDTEILSLYTLDLTKKPRLDKVRDLFIIGCYTGLRFSDLSQLTPENFTKNGTQIKIKTIKTGETVVIPLHWTIKEILQKYNGETPRAISNQKMNEYLKDLGQAAKFNEKVVLNRTQGGLSYDQTKKKSELITVHTARRSFATNMFLAEVPTISIMKITGHRTERAFMKYIKITSEQNADKLSKHPYFTKSPLKVVNQ